MRATLCAVGLVSAVFLSACSGGGTSSIPGGSSNAITPPASQNDTVSSTPYVVNASSGSAPSVTMNVISVPGLPASGGVTVAKDGAVWWESPKVPSGVMVRLQGNNVTTVSFPPGAPGTAEFPGYPFHSMTATPDGLAWGSATCNCGTAPIWSTFSATAGATVANYAPAPEQGSGLLNVVAGPDGAMWLAQSGEQNGPGGSFQFSQFLSTQISGEQFYYHPPTFYSIGVGPDKNIWIQGHNYGNSGLVYYRYPPSLEGTFPANVPIPDAKTGLDSIVAGPDGAMWGVGGNTIVRDDINGHDTIYTVGNPQTNVLKGITVGGDGALWVTDYEAMAVYRITTSGSIATYALPKGVGSPIQITGPFTSPGCGNSELWVSTVNGPIVQLIIKTS